MMECYVRVETLKEAFPDAFKPKACRDENYDEVLYELEGEETLVEEYRELFAQYTPSQKQVYVDWYVDDPRLPEFDDATKKNEDALEAHDEDYTEYLAPEDFVSELQTRKIFKKVER